MTTAEYIDTHPTGDFTARFERLRSLTGLSWVAFAREMGIGHEQMNRWREGVTPNGRGMEALTRLAARMPSGLDVLSGGDDGDRPRAA